MSYNISHWKLRSIHLALPLNFDFGQWVRSLSDRDEQGNENVGKRWCLEEHETPAVQVNLVAQTWTLEILGQELTGVVDDDALVVTALEWADDGSGHLYSGILIPLFKAFDGDLNAIVVWEGGDSINQLSIHEGIVEDKEME